MPRGRPKVSRLMLLPEQAAALAKIAESRTENPRRIQRAKALLASAEGRPNSEAANEACLSASAVARLLRKAHQVGPISALEDLQRSGRPGVVSEEARQWIKQLAGIPPKCLPDGPAHALWSVASLTDYVRTHAAQNRFDSALIKISKSTVWNILAEGGIGPLRVGYQLEKRTPSCAGSNRETLLLHTQVEIEAEMLQSHDCRSLPAGCAFSAAEDQPARRAGGIVQCQRTVKLTLLAGIDLITGKVHGIFREHSCAASADFVDFLQFVDAKFPADRPIFMMLDKRSLSLSRNIRGYLDERKNRFQFIFMPRQASCLNLVEVFFHKMARSGLCGLKVRSMAELQSRSAEWLKHCNDDIPAMSAVRRASETPK